MQRRLAHRLEVMAVKRAGERAEGNRRVVGPEGGGADLVHAAARGFGQDGDGIDVAELALVGRHAGGGVALGQLDVAIALARGQRQILGGDIVLVVDEGLALSTPSPTTAGVDGDRPRPGISERPAPCPSAFRPAHHRPGIRRAACCPRPNPRRRKPGPTSGGTKPAMRLIPPRLCTAMAGEIDDRATSRPTWRPRRRRSACDRRARRR